MNSLPPNSEAETGSGDGVDTRALLWSLSHSEIRNEAGEVVCVVYDTDACGHEDLAKLIRWAPEMLEALREVERAHDSKDGAVHRLIRIKRIVRALLAYFPEPVSAPPQNGDGNS